MGTQASPGVDLSPFSDFVVENAGAPMPDDYRDLVFRIVRDNWSAEAANASLVHHAISCPLHLAPTMNDRAAMATFWAEECNHAVFFANLMRDLGHEPTPEEYDAARPAELLRIPLETWADFGLFQLFADSAGMVHLTDYESCSYLPLREVAARCRRDEAGHIALGLKNTASALSTPDGRERIHATLSVWYRSAMELFGKSDVPSPHSIAMVRHGLRRELNADLRRRYRRMVDNHLNRLNLPIPELSP